MTISYIGRRVLVTVQRPVEDVDAAGGVTRTWEDVGSAYGYPSQRRSAESLRGDLELNVVSVTWDLRTDVSILDTYRILHGSEGWLVQTVRPHWYRPQVVVECELEES